jgi:peroxiredoxin
MVIKLGLDYKVLSDENQVTATRYGCRLDDIDNMHPVSDAHQYEGGIPLPASFLVDKKGIVRYISRAERVGEFLNPSTIFAVLETLPA